RVWLGGGSVDHHFAALELFVALLFAFPDVAEGGAGFWSQAADCLNVEGHRMRFSGRQGARLGAGSIDELLGGFVDIREKNVRGQFLLKLHLKSPKYDKVSEP